MNPQTRKYLHRGELIVIFIIILTFGFALCGKRLYYFPLHKQEQKPAVVRKSQNRLFNPDTRPARFWIGYNDAELKENDTLGFEVASTENTCSAFVCACIYWKGQILRMPAKSNTKMGRFAKLPSLFNSFKYFYTDRYVMIYRYDRQSNRLRCWQRPNTRKPCRA